MGAGVVGFPNFFFNISCRGFHCYSDRVPLQSNNLPHYISFLSLPACGPRPTGLKHDLRVSGLAGLGLRAETCGSVTPAGGKPAGLKACDLRV